MYAIFTTLTISLYRISMPKNLNIGGSEGDWTPCEYARQIQGQQSVELSNNG
jgi:hypothetical protein